MGRTLSAINESQSFELCIQRGALPAISYFVLRVSNQVAAKEGGFLKCRNRQARFLRSSSLSIIRFQTENFNVTGISVSFACMRCGVVHVR